MNVDLIEGVLRGVLGGRRKRSHNALRFLTGGRGSSFVNASTLLTAAGVAWGIFETMQNRPAPTAGSPADGTGSTGAPPPPLPTIAAASGAVSDDALRMLRLAISAAATDGAISARERAALVEHAHTAGVGELVAAELERPQSLANIVGGVTDPGQRATLYVLAFTILRADEQISGAERIYLASLANLLALDPPLVLALEQDTEKRIDAMKDPPGPS